MIAASPSAISSFTTGGSLSAFNVLGETDYNQWYTGAVGKKTILVSNFVYHITALPAESADSFSLTSDSWDIGNTGDKLCYASTLTTKNVKFILFSFKLIFVKACPYGLYGFSSYSFGFSILFPIAPTLKSTISILKITDGLVYLGIPFSILLTKNILLDYRELLSY